MKLISSRDNPLFKELKQLAASAQARRKAGRSLLDGVHLAQAWLQQVQGAAPLICIVAESAEVNAEVVSVMDACRSLSGCQCIVLPDALYQSISQVENGVGLTLVVDTPQPQMPTQLSGASVLLDGLQDPGNLGSILRSAAASGIRQVFCSPGTVAAWSPKVLRAGMGAHFMLDIFENADLFMLCADAAVPVLATSSYATRSIYQADLQGEVVWLFGHEGQGVAPELMDTATTQVVIPHAGAMESLNVAAAAAVCFFEAMRQRQAAIIATESAQ
jgi:TrmH family RNA methyltransferase